ncbi:1791_t:CDS:2 [Dentiscutata erythropus]|uniref:1791_t:CDS:1 n=1 Tax=Dentiscutata erythropus TaxID=1348616 RepID=A0A9N9F6C4_9GLOM|nr:1791_t:CDS:2 [Dentiscutata erythropus]
MRYYYPLSLIENMDETPLTFNVPNNITIEETGTRTVGIPGAVAPDINVGLNPDTAPPYNQHENQILRYEYTDVLRTVKLMNKKPIEGKKVYKSEVKTTPKKKRDYKNRRTPFTPHQQIQYVRNIPDFS